MKLAKVPYLENMVALKNTITLSGEKNEFSNNSFLTVRNLEYRVDFYQRLKIDSLYIVLRHGLYDLFWRKESLALLLCGMNEKHPSEPLLQQ